MHEKHGHNAANRLYRIWVAMRSRCYDPARISYQTYGGRGIRVCDEWRTSFPAFKAWADAAGYSDELSIDRIDSDGNYEPGNCRWATPQEQATNRRNLCVVTVDGRPMTIAEIAKDRDLHLTTLYRRYHRGVRGPEILDGLVPRHGFASAAVGSEVRNE